MSTLAEALHLESSWLESLFRFRSQQPSISLSENKEAQHRTSHPISESGHSLEPPIHRMEALVWLNQCNTLDRLTMNLGLIHKFRPGFLDRKIHQFFTGASREPLSLLNTQLGLQYKEQGILPSFGLVLYLLCGDQLEERIRLLQELSQGNLDCLKLEWIIAGERQLEDPLFSHVLVLSDAMAMGLLHHRQP
ncbi:MAG: hypothetical protein MUF42_02310 [Cytophagaceae bacterium]|nr:hypothetical protein [Cytophagaceae bacterium]